MEMKLSKWAALYCRACTKWVMEVKILFWKEKLPIVRSNRSIEDVTKAFKPCARKLKGVYRNESRENIWIVGGCRTAWCSKIFMQIASVTYVFKPGHVITPIEFRSIQKGFVFFWKRRENLEIKDKGWGSKVINGNSNPSNQEDVEEVNKVRRENVSDENRLITQMHTIMESLTVRKR